MGLGAAAAAAAAAAAILPTTLCEHITRALRPISLHPPLAPQPFLEAQGIHDPTEVQAAAVPAVLSGSNAAIRCYTGSGKTLAYLLPALTLAVERAEAEWAAVTRKTASKAGSVQVRP